jgi:hypothetical protein
VAETLLEKVISLDHTLKGNGERWRSTEENSSLILDLQNQVFFWNSKNLLYKKPIEYLTEIKGYSLKEARDLISELTYLGDNVLHIPTKHEIVTPYEKLVDVFWKNGLKDRDYWYRRGLNDSTIDRYRLGKYDGLYTLPVFMDGRFRNFQCRRDIPDKVIRPWYRGVGPLLFNSDILQIVDRIFITEGPVDCILMNQCGFPCISHTGGANGFKQEWFKYFSKQRCITYVADNDDVGLNAGKFVCKILGVNRTKIITFAGEKEKFGFKDFILAGHTALEFSQKISDAKYSFESGV